MDHRQIELVLEVCHRVDLLVSQDQGTSDLEVLEQARLRMNDCIWKHDYREAENLAYAILLVRSGCQAKDFLLEMIGN
ncbi:MAG: hypothetical protein ACYS74_17480 [Planctomycetota bacterium]|jgi:hypothetical protein